MGNIQNRRLEYLSRNNTIEQALEEEVNKMHYGWHPKSVPEIARYLGIKKERVEYFLQQERVTRRLETKGW